jgi:hypothetical protein
MKPLNDTARLILVAVAIVVLAGAFYLMLLQPKRDKAGELSTQEAALSSELSSVESTVSAAESAKAEFPGDYRQLVVLGKAVPSEAETPSLLVQLNGLSAGAHTSFRSIALGGGGEGVAVEGAEGSTALSPLGAAAGPSGLLSMPYTLEFEGGFFDVAKFMHKLDSMVVTDGTEVSAKGRLIMVDGFSLVPLSGEQSSAAGRLQANLSVNTYVTPPGQGLTSEATSAGPTEEAGGEVTEETTTTTESTE